MAAFGPMHSPMDGPMSLNAISSKGFQASTFQSHNPKIFHWHDISIFNYAHRVRPDGFVDLTFMISRDDGRHYVPFWHVAGRSHVIRPASVMGDSSGRVYFLFPTCDHQDPVAALSLGLLVFGPSNGFSQPVLSKTFSGWGAGNFTSHLDVRRRLIFYVKTANRDSEGVRPDFLTIDANGGAVVAERILTSPGDERGLDYPHLASDEDALYLAWTSWDKSTNRYDAIHGIKSEDAGRAWKTFEGEPVSLPVDSTPAGPGTSIRVEEESDLSTWLARMTFHEGVLHFFYSVRGPASLAMRYRRFDLETLSWMPDVTPEWGGKYSRIHGLDGFFTMTPGMVFFVGSSHGRRITVIASDDAGETWIDFAEYELPPGYIPYGLDGVGHLTSDGSILGVFTAQRTTPAADLVDADVVMSLRIPT